jgi:hypothetical protein
MNRTIPNYTTNKLSFEVKPTRPKIRKAIALFFETLPCSFTAHSQDRVTSLLQRFLSEAERIDLIK